MSKEPITMTYTNWRGETGDRRVTPIRLAWGNNEWHPDPQWFLVALDQVKGEERFFALRGIKEIR